MPELAEWVEQEGRLFEEAIAPVELDEALRLYFGRLEEEIEAALDEALAGREHCCGPGCGTCCHQPLAISMVEIAVLFRSDEERFRSPGFRRRLDEEMAALGRYHRSVAGDLGAVARLQWEERRPCFLLDERGLCSVHGRRPLVCRNAFATERCTATALRAFGFPHVSDLSHRFLRAIGQRYPMDALDPSGRDVFASMLWLPEGLLWLLDNGPFLESQLLFAGFRL